VPRDDRSRARGATVRLPFLTARFELGRPAAAEAEAEAEVVTVAPGALEVLSAEPAGPVPVVSPGKVAYYVGLGLLAAVEIIEWPVVAAIAAGTYVAQHSGLAGRPRARAGRRARNRGSRSAG